MNALRADHKPQIPPVLKDARFVECVKETTATTSAKDHEEIKKLFPATYGRPVVHLRKGEKVEALPIRIGVVFSGGQASGGHNVIAGLFDAIKQLHPKSHLLGFLEGPGGIVEGNYKNLSLELIDSVRNQGGFDLIGSGRVKIETEQQLQAALKVVSKLSLDGLVIIGGDDSNTNAAILAEYFLRHGSHTKVVGVPKTIDGDLKNDHVAISFGFDTACKVYAEMISNIERDALSAKKYWHFIKLMGRSASHVALECALKCHPNITLISEESRTLEELTSYIVDVIKKRQEAKKDYGVILIPEGLIEFMPNVRFGENAGYDSHGNLQVSAIETEKLFIELVSKQVKIHSVSHFFGYEGRCGFPSHFDANYCYSLGMNAALLIHLGQTGYMAFVKHLDRSPSEWELGGIPLTMLMQMEMRKDKVKPVIQKALVDLKSKPYLELQKHRDFWALNDDYQFCPPIQLFGPPEVTDTFPLILS